MVYVGTREYKFGRMIMSHMSSPDIEELHKMAEAIGHKRKWFQDHPTHPHYDVCKEKKQLAIKLGAVEVDDREIIRQRYPVLKKLMDKS